jgi:hypothetical protein
MRDDVWHHDGGRLRTKLLNLKEKLMFKRDMWDHAKNDVVNCGSSKSRFPLFNVQMCIARHCPPLPAIRSLWVCQSSFELGPCWSKSLPTIYRKWVCDPTSSKSHANRSRCLPVAVCESADLIIVLLLLTYIVPTPIYLVHAEYSMDACPPCSLPAKAAMGYILAYIEWFSPFSLAPDRHHGLYKVSHSLLGGTKVASIVPLSKIVRSAQISVPSSCESGRVMRF